MTGIRDRAAIIGIGQTEFSTHIGKTEHRVACEAIAAAIADAGGVDGTGREQRVD